MGSVYEPLGECVSRHGRDTFASGVAAKEKLSGDIPMGMGTGVQGWSAAALAVKGIALLGQLATILS
jgi:hypothetical protein